MYRRMRLKRWPPWRVATHMVHGRWVLERNRPISVLVAMEEALRLEGGSSQAVGDVAQLVLDLGVRCRARHAFSPALARLLDLCREHVVLRPGPCVRCGLLSSVTAAMKGRPCVPATRFLERLCSALRGGRCLSAVAVAYLGPGHRHSGLRRWRRRISRLHVIM